MYTNIKNKFAAGLCVLAMMLAFPPLWAEMRTHQVRQGETLYRISKLYSVTIADLQRVNPGVIEGTRVPAGAIINIPEAEENAPKKVDVSDVSDIFAANATTPAEGSLGEANAFVKAINNVSEKVSQWLGHAGRADGREVKTLATILPFNLASHSVKEDKLQMRSVEFYQGMLLAVNKAQLNGMKVRLLTYDLGTESLQEILSHPELEEADLIITPMEIEQIREVALYGQSHGINVINPFKLVPDLTPTCSRLMQLNTSTKELYPELTLELISRFDDYSFVFVVDSMFADKRDQYASYLKKELKDAGLPYYEFEYGSSESVAYFDEKLNLKDNNVFIILETNQRDALRRFFPSFKNKRFLEEHPEVTIASLREEDPDKAALLEKELKEKRAHAGDSLRLRKMAVLGYPDWQLYTADFMEHFYDLNVWMFSKFYVDPFDPDVVEVQNWFRFWYGREMLDIVPKYGLLGYDVAAYGLQMLGNYGHNFDKEADGKYVKTLQNAMLFRREGEGAFLNRGLFMVHFTPGSNIEKYEVK